METSVSAEAARFFAARRDDLNRRFERARRRWPRLEAASVLGLVAQVVAPLAGPEPAADDLCASVYDLVLLHAGRETVGSPGVAHLLRAALPALRPVLLSRPGALPAALSNAVENLGPRGVELSRMLAALGPGLASAEQLGDLAAVAAWRLGEARLRQAALRSALKLPAGAALSALGLQGWPEHALPAVTVALASDAWTHPRDALSPRALGAIRSAEEGLSLARAVTARPVAPVSTLALVGTAGDFVGFGGTFARPPLVLDAGDRHTLFARVAQDAACDWRLDADVFGTVATRIEPTGLGVRRVPDGRESVVAEALVSTTSFAMLGDVLVTTHADSHRLRIFAPRREVL